MAGTISGGLKAAEKNKQRHGPDFYRRIGRLGGQVKGTPKGFGAGKAGSARAHKYGKLGGERSKRRPTGF